MEPCLDLGYKDLLQIPSKYINELLLLHVSLCFAGEWKAIKHNWQPVILIFYSAEREMLAKDLKRITAIYLLLVESI